ncbi:MAG: type II toxin-antitoxin system PemK/MazF family toxin [Deltaproteobacteria bacterium]|nr:type II toxin-antitoxin system PemK/MazF family toxin [Deltaproteobacteria bacterium]MBW2663762.1 type II toxin-antitoxin system PemK/MazF family toxin [Deltaproteobacteria bacterium]
MNRFEIWNVRQQASHCLSEPPQPADRSKANRPYIIVSPDAVNQIAAYPFVTVIPLQDRKQRKNYPTDVWIIPSGANSLKKESIAFCQLIYTIEKTFLDFRIGMLESAYQEEITAALRRFLIL